MLSQVKDEKQAIKFSVGFRILETADDLREGDRPDRANEVAGRLFTRTDLMETSRVGIPANPDASAGVTAKSGMGGFSEHGMHPVFARMLGITAANSGNSPTIKTDGGTPENPIDALREEIAELRRSVEELREDDPDDDDDDDDDEEDGDDDEDDDDDEEESSAELAALRDELAEVRSAIEGGVGSPESKDTDTTAADATPDSERDGESSEETNTKNEESTDGPVTAADFARGK